MAVSKKITLMEFHQSYFFYWQTSTYNDYTIYVYYTLFLKVKGEDLCEYPCRLDPRYYDSSHD